MLYHAWPLVAFSLVEKVPIDPSRIGSSHSLFDHHFPYNTMTCAAPHAWHKLMLLKHRPSLFPQLQWKSLNSLNLILSIFLESSLNSSLLGQGLLSFPVEISLSIDFLCIWFDNVFDNWLNSLSNFFYVLPKLIVFCLYKYSFSSSIFIYLNILTYTTNFSPVYFLEIILMLISNDI